jgi:hypothetical protein
MAPGPAFVLVFLSESLIAVAFMSSRLRTVKERANYGIAPSKRRDELDFTA